MAQTTDAFDKLLADRLREYVKQFDAWLYAPRTKPWAGLEPFINKEINVAKTWDEAAADAADTIGLPRGWALRSTGLDRDTALCRVVDNVNAAVAGWPNIAVGDVSSYLGSAARASISYLARVLADDDTADEVTAHQDVLDRILPMVIDRQRKYGTGNILKFGQSGIAMRVHDKKARLTEGDMDFDDEKELDAWEDIVGYAIISQMLADGTFELPLRGAVTPDPLGQVADYSVKDAIATLQRTVDFRTERIEALEALAVAQNDRLKMIERWLDKYFLSWKKV